MSKQREQHDVRDVKTARHYLFLFSSHLWLGEIEFHKIVELSTINLWTPSPRSIVNVLFFFFGWGAQMIIQKGFSEVNLLAFSSISLH